MSYFWYDHLFNTTIMYFGIHRNQKASIIYLLHHEDMVTSITDDKNEIIFVQQQLKNETTAIPLFRNGSLHFIVYLKEFDEVPDTLENVRIEAGKLLPVLNKYHIKEIIIRNMIEESDAAYLFAEALTLTNYQFLPYKSGKNARPNSLDTIYFYKDEITEKLLTQLQITTQAVYHIRNLVNEPFSHQTPQQFSEQLQQIAREGRFRITTWDRKKIEQHKMAGLLTVSSGSQNDPVFNILEHKPTRYINKQPLVLVGKGVVYDTGGLSLKPTPNSMDYMKSDMAGAALVAGIMYVAGMLNLPIHIIGLIPACDNRPGENAYAPGDVITYADGTTVEVLHTDAEGRLILADALLHARKYKPELVIDFATLTGAAAAISGAEGMIMMGNAPQGYKELLYQSSIKHYERFIELPLWKEYGDMMKSEIADLKNISGGAAGAITAGKFLEFFTDFPWLHFDIAGVAYTTAPKHYKTFGGTGFGLRMMADFLLHYKSL